MQSQSRTPGRNTPGRRRNANKENVYFEPGKYGRKTGLTLKDTGRRDEHGFEPVSGIFSSPHQETPERQPLASRGLGSESRSISENMYQTLSYAPDSIAEVLDSRRTPRMAPPSNRTPRRTHIGGSPVRPSTIKNPSPLRHFEDDITPVRVRAQIPEDEEEDVVLSIERVPEEADIRSSAIAKAKRSRKSIFQLETPAKSASQTASSPTAAIIDELSHMLDTHDPLPSEQLHDSGLGDAPMLDDLPSFPEETGPADIADQSTLTNGEGSNTKKKRGVRRSDASQNAAEEATEVERHSSSKRRRISDRVSLPEPSPSLRSRTSLRHSNASVSMQPTEDAVSDLYSAPQYDDSAPQFDDEPVYEMDPEPDTVQLSNPALEDEIEDEIEDEVEDESDAASDASSARALSPIEEDAPPAPHSPRKRNRKSVRPPSRRSRNASSAPARPRAPPRPRAESQTPFEAGSGTIMGRIRLRSTTPFEETGVQVTRSGRASIKPLAYWKNETFVYEHGEVAGIVRAEELPDVKRTVVRRKVQRKKTGDGGEDEEDDEDEDEDLLPEAWEEEVGIINGPVRAWDAQTGMGSVEDVELKDVAFASRAIATQDVSGGLFRYAKVLTEPFFGAGVVEVPPLGTKKSKNCRRMVMAFFVHEGKVTVEVAGMKFGVAKGGMWQVPRGNNYSIENESAKYPAKMFFAQGCEIETEGAGEQSLVT